MFHCTIVVHNDSDEEIEHKEHADEEEDDEVEVGIVVVVDDGLYNKKILQTESQTHKEGRRYRNAHK